jgi:hypothetical protein
MEVSAAILEAITHAVRGVERRSEGLAAIGDRHSAASKAALNKVGARAGRLVR